MENEPDINEIPEDRDRVGEMRARCDFDALTEMVDARTKAILERMRDGYDESEIAAEFGLPPLYVTARLIPAIRSRFGGDFAD